MAKKMKKHGDLIVCYPVLQGNGAKYTATNLADAIKNKNREMSVALIDLDFKAPYLAGYLSGHDKVHTIDNLIERLDGGFLDEEAIKENMVELKNGVELLKGTKLKNTYYFIKQEHIRQILVMLKKMYDVIVVAVSNGNDSLSTMVAMLSADHIILVAKNDYSNYLSLENEIAFVQNYASDEGKIKLIFNMYDADSDLDFHPILSEAKIPLVGWIPYDKDTINNRHIKSGKLVGKLLKTKKEESPYDELVSSLFSEVEND